MNWSQSIEYHQKHHHLEEKEIELIGLSVTKIALFQIIRFQEHRDDLISVGLAEVFSISISLVSIFFFHLSQYPYLPDV